MKESCEELGTKNIRVFLVNSQVSTVLRIVHNIYDIELYLIVYISYLGLIMFVKNIVPFSDVKSCRKQMLDTERVNIIVQSLYMWANSCSCSQGGHIVSTISLLSEAMVIWVS